MRAKRTWRWRHVLNPRATTGNCGYQARARPIYDPPICRAFMVFPGRLRIPENRGVLSSILRGESNRHLRHAVRATRWVPDTTRRDARRTSLLTVAHALRERA